MILKTTLQAFLLIAPIIASPLPSALSATKLERRNLFDDTIKSVLNSVVDSTNDLTTKVQAFTGNIADSAPILEASTGLLGTIQNGTAIVKSADTLSLIQTLAALPSVFELNTAVEGVSNALIKKKSTFDSGGLTSVVLDQLQQQKSAAQGLVDALLDKLPKYLPSSLGTLLSDPALEALDKAVKAFGG
jgi:hypothetical protein